MAWLDSCKDRLEKSRDWVSEQLASLKVTIFETWRPMAPPRIDPGLIDDVADQNKIRLGDRSADRLSLLDILIHPLIFTLSFTEQPTGTANEFSKKINNMIAEARSAVINTGVSMDTFNDALFPVLAWIDERVSLTHQWEGSDAWQDFLLQRMYFRTTLAGVEFFERLEDLDERDVQVREVFLMCLCLGFMGKYNTQPDASDLAEIRLRQYRIFQALTHGNDPLEGLLFPQAYQRDDEALPNYVAPWKKWLTIRNGLILGVPVIIIIIMLIALNHTLENAVDSFRTVTHL